MCKEIFVGNWMFLVPCCADYLMPMTEKEEEEKMRKYQKKKKKENSLYWRFLESFELLIFMIEIDLNIKRRFKMYWVIRFDSVELPLHCSVDGRN